MTTLSTTERGAREPRPNTPAQTRTTLMAVAVVAAIGAATVFTVGLAQSPTLHNAAHDTRHATGFPCH